MSSGSQEKHAEVRGELARELRQFQWTRRVLLPGGGDSDRDDRHGYAGHGYPGEYRPLDRWSARRSHGAYHRGDHRDAQSVGGGRACAPGARPQRWSQGHRPARNRARTKGSKIGSIFDSLGKAWDEVASHYDDEQIAFLLEFLKRSNALSRQEIVRLREAPAGEEGNLLRSAGRSEERSARRLLLESPG